MHPASESREPEGPGEGAAGDARIIAERRARRAELSEGRLRARAQAAEDHLAQARGQLAGAHDQRAELAARLKQAERDLRAARQGEHAETHLRAEVEEDAARARREAEEQLAGLRAALAVARLRIRELEVHVERLQRSGPTADGDAGAERLRAALLGEQRRRVEAERALEAERERAAAEVTLLGYELDRRIAAHAATTRELAELAAGAAGPTAGRDPRWAGPGDSVLQTLGAAALALRDELRGLEDERRAAEARLREAEQTMTALARAAATAHDTATAERERADAAVAELERLQAGIHTRAALETAVAASVTELRAELERLRAERGLRESQLDQVARGLAGTAAETRIAELEDELEQVRIALRPAAAAMPRADHPALGLAGPGGQGAAGSVIVDLARAAARLRAPRPGVEPEGDDGVAARTGPAVLMGPRAPAIGRRVPGPWLTSAIVALGREDPGAAAAAVEALIPVQAARLSADLTYHLGITGRPELRVRLGRDGTSSVILRSAADPGAAADFRVSGTPVALAPLVGGGAGRRRPAGVIVSGGRRPARRLARALRDPVGLSGIAAARIPGLPAHLLLQLLAVAIDPAGTRGEAFTLSFAEAQDTPVHVVVADGLPPVVRPGAVGRATAAVTTGRGQLAAFLAGDGPAQVAGDTGAVARFLAMVDRAQGLAPAATGAGGPRRTIRPGA